MTGSSAESTAAERLQNVRSRIAAAARRCGRDPESVQLVAISKGQSIESVRTLATLGLRDFGENYLQEGLPKLDALQELPLTWHFTGQMQGNKTRAIAERFHWVHTVDRERIATRLHEQRPHYAPPLNVCIQVQLAPEPGKGGVPIAEVESLAAHVAQLPRLKLRGLMCVPPPAQNFEAQHLWFEQLASRLKHLNQRGFTLDTLSMGMSADVEAAIAAGATIVRIGTALFGDRQYQSRS